jgi:hypothetical protein
VDGIGPLTATIILILFVSVVQGPTTQAVERKLRADIANPS